jgi:hypothetical protein
MSVWTQFSLKYEKQIGQILSTHSGIKAGECFTESVAYFRLCGSDALSEQVETEQSALAENPTNKPEINGA